MRSKRVQAFDTRDDDRAVAHIQQRIAAKLDRALDVRTLRQGSADRAAQVTVQDEP